MNAQHALRITTYTQVREHMTARVKHQAHLIAKAPNPAAFAETLAITMEHMDELDAFLLAQNGRSFANGSEPSKLVDPIIPRPEKTRCHSLRAGRTTKTARRSRPRVAVRSITLFHVLIHMHRI